MAATTTAAERAQRAEASLQQALETNRQDSLEVCRASIEAGIAQCTAGNIQAAERLLESQLVDREPHSGLKGHETAGALEALGYVYGVLEDHQREHQMLNRALTLREQGGSMATPAAASMAVAVCLSAIAENQARRGGSQQEQVATLKRAAALLEESRDHQRPLQALVHRTKFARLNKLNAWSSNVTAADGESGDVGRFLSLLVLFGSSERTVGRTDNARVLDALALLEELREDVSSKTLTDTQKLQKLVQLASERHGQGSVQAAQWLVLLAEKYGWQGDFDRKRETLLRVLRIQEKEFGYDSIFIAGTLRALAHATGQLGKLEMRKAYLARALDLQEDELGSQHSETAATRRYLQALCEELRKVRDPTGSKDLMELFPPQAPMFPKVNRFTQDVSWPAQALVLPEQVEKRLAESAAQPFPFAPYGGGSCAYAEEGALQVPHYFPVT